MLLSILSIKNTNGTSKWQESFNLQKCRFVISHSHRGEKTPTLNGEAKTTQQAAFLSFVPLQPCLFFPPCTQLSQGGVLERQCSVVRDDQRKKVTPECESGYGAVGRPSLWGTKPLTAIQHIDWLLHKGGFFGGVQQVSHTRAPDLICMFSEGTHPSPAALVSTADSTQST